MEHSTKEEEGGVQGRELRNLNKESESPSLEFCTALDHRPAIVRQETVQAGFQQRPKVCGEQREDGTCVEVYDASDDPARTSFLNRRNDRGSRVWVERVDDCVEGGRRSTVRMRFELEMTSDSHDCTGDEETLA